MTEINQERLSRVTVDGGGAAVSDIERYDGLCIDGPHIGARRSEQRPRFFVAVASPPAPRFDQAPDVKAEAIDYSKIEYRHVAFHFHNDAKGTSVAVGFWVSEKTDNPRLYILDRLVTSFERRHQ